MKRIWKWLAVALLVPVLLLGAVAVALQQWVGSADFRSRVAQQASAALGVPVNWAASRWTCGRCPPWRWSGCR